MQPDQPTPGGVPLVTSPPNPEVQSSDGAAAPALLGLETWRTLAAHLEAVREEERAHLAREMHDELGQLLTILKMDLIWLQNRLAGLPDTPELEPLRAKTVGMVTLLDSAIRAGRRVAGALRPAFLEAGLAEALRWQVQEFQSRYGVRCQVDLAEVAPARQRDAAIYRIAQEALTNVARHAAATEVHVSLDRDGDTLVLEVVDNGRGMTVAQARSLPTFGLTGMRERAALLGGTLEVTSAPGKGSCILALAPLMGGPPPQRPGGP